MEIRDLAERILHGASLEEKLITPDGLSDARPGPPRSAPDFPARLPELRPASQERRRRRVPGATRLEGDRARGEVLHDFANHELLALELMAVMLLAFPEAPPEFRRGLADTLLDEQRHFRLYRDRMRELGVDFGDVPVSRFFWDALTPLASPVDFVAGMSLTFEQANLDFSLHYARAFDEIGDTETSALLHEVYEDEIRHVRHGLDWFETWRPGTDDLFSELEAALPGRLTARHAKGQSFSRVARERAGLPDAYIDRLELYSRSKGRPPRVFVFNPDCEGEIAAGRGRPLTEEALALTTDLELLPLVAASSDDVVLVGREPEPAHLERLLRAGFDLPEFVVVDERRELSQRDLLDLEPWGWSPVVHDLLQPLRRALVPDVPRHPGWREELRPIFTKSWSAELAAELLPTIATELPITRGTEHAIESSPSVFAAAERLGYPVVVKADLGAAGRNAIRLLEPRMEARQARWHERILEQQGRVVVSPWRDRTLDLSFHLDVAADGSSRFAGVVRFAADRRGQFEHAVVGSATRGLDEEHARLLVGDGSSTPLTDLAEGLCERVGAALAARGHVGPAGIDALVFRDEHGSLRLDPLVEINPRWTMGRLALRLQRHVVHGVPARLALVRADEVPPRSDVTLDRGRIRSGALPLTDPTTARHVVALLTVGD